MREVDPERHVARATETAQDRHCRHPPRDVRVNRSRNADRPEHHRDERDDPEELLKIVERVSQRLSPILRCFDPPSRFRKFFAKLTLGLLWIGAGWEFEVKMMEGETRGAEQPGAGQVGEPDVRFRCEATEPAAPRRGFSG